MSNATFHSLKVASVIPETADAVCLSFEVPAKLEEVFAFHRSSILRFGLSLMMLR